MPNSRDILYRAGYTRTLIDISSAGYDLLGDEKCAELTAAL
jgi:hypothetical protein